MIISALRAQALEAPDHLSLTSLLSFFGDLCQDGKVNSLELTAKKVP